MVMFQILQKQYWTFLYCSQFSYCSSNFAIAKVVAFCRLASFLYAKKDAERIKRDNFTRSNREKSNKAIAILEI